MNAELLQAPVFVRPPLPSRFNNTSSREYFVVSDSTVGVNFLQYPTPINNTLVIQFSILLF